jgi:hypothetical protein
MSFATLMLKYDGTWVARPSVSPFRQSNDRWLEILALRREDIVGVFGARSGRASLHEAGFDEVFEASCKNVGGDSKAALKV